MSAERGCHDDRNRPASWEDHRGTPSARHKVTVRSGKAGLKAAHHTLPLSSARPISSCSAGWALELLARARA